MPLDGHLYLVSQGWRGKGTGLREGAVTRPLAVPQKKNLAGLGKDRDEAFPFWDHLFTTAAKSIQLKCSSDSDGESNTATSSCSKGAIRRTTTGIPSNRRPVEGTSAMSNPSTPSADSGPSKPRVNVLVAAKRAAAKQSLYSRFFRGPVIGSGDDGRGSISRDTILIEDVTVVEIMSINAKAVMKEGTTSKRERDLEGGSGEGVRQQKTKRMKREDDSKRKGKMTASPSVAQGTAAGIDSNSKRKSRKAEKKKRKKLDYGK